MRRIKVKFVDFWKGFNPEESFIFRTLAMSYEVELSDSPEYLFFSNFGNENLRYTCVKIEVIGENISPDFNIADYAIGFNWLEYGDRYLRLPIYQWWDKFERFRNGIQHTKDELEGKKFCSIVVSNLRYADPTRERMFRLLSEYKQVDSGGRAWNNVGGPVKDKIAFLQGYKFTLSIENSEMEGYTTEKVMEAMLAETMPIYWGNPAIGRDFNPKSIISLYDFPSLEAAAEYIVKLDQDEDRYIEKLNEPWLLDESAFRWQEVLSDFLRNIIDKPLEKAGYISRFGYQFLYRKKLIEGDILVNKLRGGKVLTAIERLKKK